MNEKEQSGIKLINTNIENLHGFVVSGGNNTLHIHFGKDGMTVDKAPAKTAIDFLDEEVRRRIDEGQQPKHILLPVRGAKEALVNLPFSNEVGFNNRYHTNISHNAWSRWINGTDNCGYEERELEAFVKLFTSCER